MRVIDGTGVAMGRLASYVAKQALKGEEIAVVNCKEVVITGNRKNSLKRFAEGKGKIGSGQQGPKYSKDIDKIVKRSIRGMLPNARRSGRGRDALKNIKCYVGVPKELENAEKEKIAKTESRKQNKIGELFK